MNPFDSYMLNKVRRLKDVRTQYVATGEKSLLAGVPEEDREFVTGVWPPEFERILNGESASMLAQLGGREAWKPDMPSEAEVFAIMWS